jgi:glutamine synthetase
MNLQSLKSQIRSGAIDTVIVAFPDVFGRLVGKRFRAEFFLKSVAEHGTHSCNYLLTANIEMDPLDGFKVANWDSGFGDFEMRPDLSTMRALPWQPGAVLVICDYLRHDGRLVEEAPRSVLRRQLDRLRKQKLTCFTASELEFFLFNQTFHDAFAAEYRRLTPSSDYRIDYHTLQPARDEALFRAVRNGMTAAGVPVESSKGEWGRGQHEVNFIYDQPLPMADMHVVFKQGMKELASQHGQCVTFMPKPWAAEVGSSCHIQHVEPLSRQHFCCTRIGQRYAKCLRAVARPLRITVAYGDQLDLIEPAPRREMVLRDITGADNADAQFPARRTHGHMGHGADFFIRCGCSLLWRPW